MMKIENVVMMAVGVLLLAAVMVPIINNVQYDYGTDENADADQLYALDDELTITLGTNAITVNGDDIAVSSLTYLVVADDFFITATGNTAFALYTNTGAVTDLEDLTYSNGKLLTTDASSVDGEYPIASREWYVVADNGEYGIWNHGSDSVNANSNTDVILLGTTTLTGGTDSESVSYIFKGHLKGTFASTMAITSGSDEVTGASVTVPSTQVTTDTDNSLKFSNGTVTVKATVDGTELSGTATVMVFVPVEYVTYEPADNQYGAILGIVPILVGVGLIIACVGEFVTRRA